MLTANFVATSQPTITASSPMNAMPLQRTVRAAGTVAVTVTLHATSGSTATVDEPYGGHWAPQTTVSMGGTRGWSIADADGTIGLPKCKAASSLSCSSRVYRRPLYQAQAYNYLGEVRLNRREKALDNREVASAARDLARGICASHHSTRYEQRSVGTRGSLLVCLRTRRPSRK